MSYSEIIWKAIYVCPFVAFLLAFFFICFQYKKYGAISVYRAVVVYLFMLFCMCAYFLIILPLPEPAKVEARKGPIAQLMPFEVVRAFFCDSGLNLLKPSTYLKSLKSREFIQPFFNFFLLFPLGFFLRYLFKCSKKKAWFISLLATLFFEITQYTGLYGFYLRPYRLLDVDDLILNSTGSMLGYYVTCRIERFLPSWDKINSKAYKRAKLVNCKRRLVSSLVDGIMVHLITGLTIGILYIGRVIRIIATNEAFLEKDVKVEATRIYVKWIVAYTVVYISYYAYHLIKHKGVTIGKKVTGVGLAMEDGSEPSFNKLFVYYLQKSLPSLCLELIEPTVVFAFLKHLDNPITSIICKVISYLVILDGIYAWFAFKGKYKKLYYERFTGVCNCNTIVEKTTYEEIIDSIDKVESKDSIAKKDKKDNKDNTAKNKEKNSKDKIVADTPITNN